MNGPKTETVRLRSNRRSYAVVITRDERDRAERAVLESDYTYPERALPLSGEEVICVLDAIANEEDVADHLEEHRRWRSRRGLAERIDR